ncbi:MAG: ribonuclease P protein component [Armatimonadota bacterium]|nr:ribonuclease P protein component [Armatimonadota bacterium]
MAASPRLGRLAREDDFRRVYRNGVRRSTALVVIHALPNTVGELRLGLAVGRRLGRAVARNRVRRRLREAVRALRARLHTGHDIVLTPKAEAARAPFGQMRRAVEEALTAAGLLASSAGDRA